MFAPLGSPRAFAQNSTLPWTFGQGRTHPSGWRYDSRTDPPDGARPDLAADAQATPQRPAGITTPWLQKCTDGPDQPVSFLRPTELASADALADEPLGRCRDAVVARGAEVLDH